MTNIDPLIFRAYDIRGKAGTQITEEACRCIGLAFGKKVRERYGVDSPKIALGRDARTHGPLFENAVMEGLLSAGCHVLRIGQTPSPINYFTICTMGLDGGVQITASHNPKDDNGIKLQLRNAEAFSGEHLQDLKKSIDAMDSDVVDVGQGSSEEIDAISPYLDHLETLFGGVGEGLSVVLDTGNGVAGPVYQEVLKRVGCTVTGLYIEPDGTFPHHAADPSKKDTLQELQETVVAKGANIGFGFDGDGDRLGVVDEHGTILSADDILLLLSKDHLSRHPGAPVIFTVSNSSVLESEITSWGGAPIMVTVGHSFVEHAMTEHASHLGGEQSGHFFCGEDYFDFDDAIVAALRVLAILNTSKTSLHTHISAFPKVFQAQERRPQCPDDQKEAIVHAITEHFKEQYPVNDLDGARIDFGDGAWAGIRKSNTSPCLSVCIEARSPKKLEEVEEIILSHLEQYPDIEL